jgi:hypothetical protein
MILKANKVKLFVASVLFVFWYHSPKLLDTPRISEYTLLLSSLAFRINGNMMTEVVYVTKLMSGNTRHSLVANDYPEPILK